MYRALEQEKEKGELASEERSEMEENKIIKNKKRKKIEWGRGKRLKGRYRRVREGARRSERGWGQIKWKGWWGPCMRRKIFDPGLCTDRCTGEDHGHSPQLKSARNIQSTRTACVEKKQKLEKLEKAVQKKTQFEKRRQRERKRGEVMLVYRVSSENASKSAGGLGCIKRSSPNREAQSKFDGIHIAHTEKLQQRLKISINGPIVLKDNLMRSWKSCRGSQIPKSDNGGPCSVMLQALFLLNPWVILWAEPRGSFTSDPFWRCYFSHSAMAFDREAWTAKR